MIKAGADINMGKCMGEVSGITPIHQAVSNKHIEAVKVLVELGANVNARATGVYVILDRIFRKIIIILTFVFSFMLHFKLTKLITFEYQCSDQL